MPNLSLHFTPSPKSKSSQSALSNIHHLLSDAVVDLPFPQCPRNDDSVLERCPRSDSTLCNFLSFIVHRSHWKALPLTNQDCAARGPKRRGEIADFRDHRHIRRTLSCSKVLEKRARFNSAVTKLCLFEGYILFREHTIVHASFCPAAAIPTATPTRSITCLQLVPSYLLTQ